jgi:putative ABC transport system permease protein
LRPSCPGERFPPRPTFELNLPVLLFTLAVSTLSGLLFGCAPAWSATRVDPAEVLKEGGRSGAGVGRHRIRRLLVIGEFALALGPAHRSRTRHSQLLESHPVDLGTSTTNIQTFSLPVPDSRPKDPARINAYYQQMIASIKAVPGVLDAAVSTGLPLEGH